MPNRAAPTTATSWASSERCAPGAIDALHAYYEALNKRSHIEDGGATFQLVDARLSTLAAQLPPPLGRLVAGAAGQIKNATEFLVRGKRAAPGAKAHQIVADEFRHARKTAGNCAQWTSSGIVFAGLIPRTRLFPKSILIDLLESETRNGREKNVHVVLYEHVKAAPPYIEGFRFKRRLRASLVAGAEPYLLKYAGVRRRHREREGRDGRRRQKNGTRAGRRRGFPVWRAASVGGPTLILSAPSTHRADGPVAAAVWLGCAGGCIKYCYTKFHAARGRGVARAALRRRPTCIPRARGGGSPPQGSRRPRPRPQSGRAAAIGRSRGRRAAPVRP